MKRILVFFFSVIIFVACNDAKKSKITGKWQLIEKVGLDPNDTIPKGDTAYVLMNEAGDYFSLLKQGPQIDTFSTGKYELIDGGKKMVTSNPRSVDTAEIMELSNTTLKVKTQDGTLTLKKVN